MKKQNYILTALLVLFAAVASFGQSTAELDKVSNFHGIRFGSQITTAQPVKLVETKGDFAMYKYLGKNTYGILTLDEADLLTKDDEVVAFQLKFSGEAQGRQLVERLSQTWGEPKYDDSDQSLNWAGRQNGAIFTYDRATRQFTLVVVHLNVVRYTETSL